MVLNLGAKEGCQKKCAVFVQGMNFVAGCLLLFMDEEDAFWSLACVIEDLLPGYFSTAMVEPQVGHYLDSATSQ